MQRTGFVHQIAISDRRTPELSGYLRRADESVRAAFPQRQHRLWWRDDGARFIRDHFGPTVGWAFDTLRPYAYQADLLKYCLLHEHGGWLIDLGVTMLQPPEPLIGESRDPDFVLFRETGGWSAPWNVSLAVLYARPGSPVFARAIREVVRNCARHEYGANPICPTLTGLGRAFAIEDVHRFLGLATGTFIAIHIVTAIVDDSRSRGWICIAYGDRAIEKVAELGPSAMNVAFREPGQREPDYLR